MPPRVRSEKLLAYLKQNGITRRRGRGGMRPQYETPPPMGTSAHARRQRRRKAIDRAVSRVPSA